ncbi:hypothetical protein [Lewinella sp. 4G2]|uniref:hypothetical protein n=1 Tax=Lewinella sp. 4G2 TaxID=1803372 RepID=UPI0007B4E355|nr:hypothetical protein [Lewinella sp. 4G2]OAV45082.1 hypothetical protein A3850_011550 [Lewinella sp. 4G2]
MTSKMIYSCFEGLYDKFDWPIIENKSEYVHIGNSSERDLNKISLALSHFIGEYLFVVLNRNTSCKTKNSLSDVNNFIMDNENMVFVEITWKLCLEIKGEVMRVGYLK